MQYISKNIFWVLITTVMLANGGRYHQRPVVISGTVLGEWKKPVEKCWLYIITGEEEAISGKDGKFTISTWQPFPVTITAEHIQYKKQHLKIDKPANDIIIKLEPR